MGLFGFGKKEKVLDLTEGYKRKMAKAEEVRAAQKESSVSSGAGPFSFFDTPREETPEQDMDSSGDSEERKKKLAKRILDMTEKMEDLGNQIYHLQQRIEVIEKKNDVRRL